TRKTLAGTPDQGWFPQERITIEEAIQAYTLNSAYASFEENIKGSIAEGKLADMVVLSDNLLTIDANLIKDVKVLMTIVGGSIVHRQNPL
ncbi:MAG: amidohydrolase family protein, partial [Myxococcota bacterium]